MKKAVIAIMPPFVAPPEQAEIVIFAGGKNYVPEYDSAAMLSKSSKYAKKYGVHLVPERFVANKNLCLCIFSPDGEPIGAQRACHINMDYRGRFNRVNSCEVIKTKFGKIALLVDVDLNKPQMCREAVLQGAVLIIGSQFFENYDFHNCRCEFGAVNAAVSNHVPVAAAIGIGGMLVDDEGGLIQGYGEYFPIVGEVELSENPQLDTEAMEKSKQLLIAHYQSLTDEKMGGGENA